MPPAPQPLRLLPGTLLAAHPELRDPNFMHGVVALFQHTDVGAYGLVVNRRIDLAVRELLPEHPVLSELDTPVWLGGPVDHRRLQYLHAAPERVPGGVEVAGGVHLGGDLDALAELLAERAGTDAPAPVRLFLGYAGWGAGQLEAELTEGAWVAAPFARAAVFAGEGEPTWRAVVRSIPGGEELGWLPPDVSWN